jgi:hypothetical protein
MSRIGLVLITILFFFTSSLIAQSEDIYYYLYEYTDEDGNKVAIIIEMATDNPTSPGSEFSEVTADEIHQKGYLTPSESQKQAKIIDEHTDQAGGFWGSYVNYGNTQDQWKWVDCGSFTGYTSAIVGPVYVRGSTWRQDWPPPSNPILVYELSISRQATWVKVQYHYEYGNPVTFQWTQKGQHHWGNPNNMEHSQASAIW